MVYVMLWRSPVCRVRWVVHGPWLWWGAVMTRVVGLALVSGHCKAGARGNESMVQLLVVPFLFAMEEWWPPCGVWCWWPTVGLPYGGTW